MQLIKWSLSRPTNSTRKKLTRRPYCQQMWRTHIWRIWRHTWLTPTSVNAMYIPILHEAHLSLPRGFFSRLRRKRWGGRHNHARGNGACGCCADLVCLYISRGSWKEKWWTWCKTLKHCDLVELGIAIINLNIHFGLKGEKKEQVILTNKLKESALFGSLLRIVPNWMCLLAQALGWKRS